MPWTKVDQALQNLRCNAWRFNAMTKQYDRVDEDVKVVEDRIKSLEYLLHCIRTAPQTDEITRTIINQIMGDK